MPRPRDSATTVYGTYPLSPSKSLSSPIKAGEDCEQKRRRKKTLKSCAREEEEEEDVEDVEMEAEPTEAEKALETSTEDVAAQDDTAATNFDTSLLDDNDIHVTAYVDNDVEEKVGETQDENVPSEKVNNSEGRVKKKAFGCSKCSSRFYSQVKLTEKVRVI